MERTSVVSRLLMGDGAHASRLPSAGDSSGVACVFSFPRGKTSGGRGDGGVNGERGEEATSLQWCHVTSATGHQLRPPAAGAAGRIDHPWPSEGSSPLRWTALDRRRTQAVDGDERGATRRTAETPRQKHSRRRLSIPRNRDAAVGKLPPEKKTFCVAMP